MKSKVLNNSIGSRSTWSYPHLTSKQEREIIAELFEQLMLFDKVIISTNRLNFGLYFLIKNLGLYTVEQLLEKDYLSFMLWTPVLVSGGGTQLEDGTIDESVIYSQPPIVAGVLSNEDIDSENNVNKALVHFNISRDQKRQLTRKIAEKYMIPDGMTFSKESAELVIDSYKKDALREFGLPFEKEPNMLNLNERQLMLNVGTNILETSILSDFNMKSYRNFEHYQIFKKSIENIGKAFKIADNSAAVFNYDHLPNLKELFLQEKLPFESVFSLRNKGNAKYFRKWINGIGEVVDSRQITIEYLNEIKGNNKPLETEDKLIYTMSSILAGAGIGAISNSAIGLSLGAGLTIFENYILDNLLKGKNPSMFIEDVKTQLDK
jgi:hypothetical protein